MHGAGGSAGSIRAAADIRTADPPSPVYFDEINLTSSMEPSGYFPLLFDERHLSMRAIAEEANSNHPKVGRFIRELVERGLVTRTEDDNGAVTYRDRFDLRDLLED